jgi:hypothetical protein
MKKWFESNSGRVSAMRIMAVPGFYMSVCAALYISIVIGVTLKSDLISLVITWLTFAGGCLGLKKLQKDKESSELK